MLSYNKIQRLTVLGLAIGLAACGTGLPGPGEEAFDADATTADLGRVEAVYETPAFAALEALGGQFRVPGAVLASEAANLMAETPNLRRSVIGRATEVSHRLVEILESSSMAPLIPSQYLGITLVWNGEEYAIDEERTDGPSDGIRFILYAVNPVTHRIAEPLTEIGYADVIDIGTDNSSGVRLVVVSGDVTYADYSVTASGLFNAFSVTIEGYLSDGENQVDFSLTHAIAVTFATTDIDIDYQIDIESRDFSLTVELDVSEVEGQGTTSTLNITVMHGRNTVTVSGDVTDDTGTLEVSGNGEVFATITMTDGEVEVVGANGEPLNERQVRALRELMEMIERAFEAYDNLFKPVSWLFQFDD